jgi:hypothetical protein
MHGCALFAVCRFVKLLRQCFQNGTEIRSAAGLHLKPKELALLSKLNQIFLVEVGLQPFLNFNNRRR